MKLLEVGAQKISRSWFWLSEIFTKLMRFLDFWGVEVARRNWPRIDLNISGFVPERSQSKNILKKVVRLVNFCLDIGCLGGLLGSFLFKLGLHQGEKPKTNWVNLQQKIRKRKKHVIYPP